MGKIFALCLILIILGIILALPLWICGNFLLWCFGASFCLTLRQAYGISLCIILYNLLFKNKEEH
jgi:hypothetical protein